MKSNPFFLIWPYQACNLLSKNEITETQRCNQLSTQQIKWGCKAIIVSQRTEWILSWPLQRICNSMPKFGSRQIYRTHLISL